MPLRDVALRGEHRELVAVHRLPRAEPVEEEDAAPLGGSGGVAVDRDEGGGTGEREFLDHDGTIRTRQSG
jgi:hypothetical protein